MASQDWATKDFYAALGVSKDASKEEISKAYRKLARKYHPDRNPGDKVAEDKFKEISEAHDVLSNEEDRKQYDAIRSMSQGGFGGFGPGGFGGFGGGSGGINLDDLFGGGGGKFSQGDAGLFDDLFGGKFQGGFGGFGSRRRERGADVRASISLPLRQAVDGTTVTVNTGLQQVTARIPAGVSDGQKIRITGKGHPGKNGGEPGDIIVEVSVEPHPVFELKGRDVYLDVPVSFDEAALGATIDVPTIHGDIVKVKVPAGSSTDKALRVRDRGLDNRRDKAGDMYVRLKVVVPRKLSEESRAAVEAFRDAANGADPRRDFRDMARL